jgi:hypothetical protein
VEPDTIVTLLNRMDQSSDAGAVCPYTPMTWPLPDPAMLADAWKNGTLHGGKPVDPDAAEVSVEYPAGAAMLVRRSFVRGMHFFDERYGNNWSDLELCWQLKNAGKKIVVLPRAKVTEISLAAEPDALSSADSIIGAGAYVGKHHGMLAGVSFRLGAIVHSLLHFNLGRCVALITGQKVDGSQA